MIYFTSDLHFNHDKAFCYEPRGFDNVEELMEPIYKKAQEKMQEIAKAGGYIYVFDRGSILYIDEAQSTDITAECRKALGIPENRTLESLQAELAAQAQATANAQ